MNGVSGWPPPHPLLPSFNGHLDQDRGGRRTQLYIQMEGSHGSEPVGSDQTGAPSASSPPPSQQHFYHFTIFSSDSASALGTRGDVCSCLLMLLVFCFFASMVVIPGLYSPVDLLVSPNCSRLLTANSFLVQSIRVKAGGGAAKAAVLYGFLDEPPPLGAKVAWSDAYNASVLPNVNQQWAYYLNSGARIDISYSVKTEGSAPLILIIAQGKASLIQWSEDTLNPNTALSWNLLNGNGTVQQKIVKSSDYYIVVANLNPIETEVHLIFQIQTIMFNTSSAYYKCSLDHGFCDLNLFLLMKNVGVLTIGGPEQAEESDEPYVTLSYGPRWITYFFVSGALTLVTLLAFKILTGLQFIFGNGSSRRDADATTERSPLLLKQDDDSSLGSSYDSVSTHDEENTEELFGRPSEFATEDDADHNSGYPVCAICYTAQRDCFFLPCGHSVTCFGCGIRISNEAGTCPICRRKTKKVRKVIAV